MRYPVQTFIKTLHRTFKGIGLCLVMAWCLAPEAFAGFRPQHEAPGWLSQEEITFLKQHPTLRIGPDPFFPPIEFLDENQVYRGIAADFVEELRRILPVDFEVIKARNWDKIIRQTKAREIDLLPAAAWTPQRDTYLDFTPPYLTLPGTIIAQRDKISHITLSELEGKRVGVTKGYAIHDYVTNRFPKLNLVPVPSIESGLEKVAYGELDVMLCINAPALYYIRKNGLTNLHIAGKSGYALKLSFATRNDWPALQSILTKAIEQIPEKRKNEILTKWMGRVDGGENRMTGAVATGFFISAILLVVFFTWMILRTQKRRYQAKIDALQAELESLKSNKHVLDEKLNKYISVFHYTPAPLAILDVDGTVLEMNPGCQRLFALQTAGSTGRYFSEFTACDEQEREALIKRWKKARASQPQKIRITCRTFENQLFPATLTFRSLEGRLMLVHISPEEHDDHGSGTDT